MPKLPKGLRAAALMMGPLGLGACAVPPPSGPSVVALPPAGKNFQQFQREDAECRDLAWRGIGGGVPAEAAAAQGVGTAALGTAAGAAAGALIGAAAGNAGAGAAIGAGTGLAAGTAVAAGQAQATGGNLQRAYDITYAQCMAAAGNSIPPPPQVVTVPVPQPYVWGPSVWVAPPPVYVYPRPYWYGRPWGYYGRPWGYRW